MLRRYQIFFINVNKIGIEIDDNTEVSGQYRGRLTN